MVIGEYLRSGAGAARGRSRWITLRWSTRICDLRGAPCRKLQARVLQVWPFQMPAGKHLAIDWAGLA